MCYLYFTYRLLRHKSRNLYKNFSVRIAFLYIRRCYFSLECIIFDSIEAS